ncbi:hypothetical protein [Aliikangiella coralliicola]|uniref:hypothetical protein n=1 Tax=Aliikangiella coralliicola TaxID=2592383 RepID=UPI00143DBC4E|nr:hypothetical protein [Aliikangiella coralliicola]
MSYIKLLTVFIAFMSAFIEEPSSVTTEAAPLKKVYNTSCEPFPECEIEAYETQGG